MNTRESNSLQRFPLSYEYQEDISELPGVLKRTRLKIAKLNLRRNKKFKRG